MPFNDTADAASHQKQPLTTKCGYGIQRATANSVKIKPHRILSYYTAIFQHFLDGCYEIIVKSVGAVPIQRKRYWRWLEQIKFYDFLCEPAASPSSYGTPFGWGKWAVKEINMIFHHYSNERRSSTWFERDWLGCWVSCAHARLDFCTNFIAIT